MDALLITLAIVVLFALFFIFLLYKIIQIRKKKTRLGTFIGEKAVTIDPITTKPTGYVRFKGEYWQAKSKEPIDSNTKVLIVGKDDTILIVQPLEKTRKV